MDREAVIAAENGIKWYLDPDKLQLSDFGTWTVHLADERGEKILRFDIALVLPCHLKAQDAIRTNEAPYYWPTQDYQWLQLSAE